MMPGSYSNYFMCFAKAYGNVLSTFTFLIFDTLTFSTKHVFILLFVKA